MHIKEAECDQSGDQRRWNKHEQPALREKCTERDDGETDEKYPVAMTAAIECDLAVPTCIRWRENAKDEEHNSS